MPLPTIPSGNVNSGLATGFDVANSVIFDDGSSPELSKTYTLSEPWTFSAWVKRGELGSENLILGASGGEIHFNSDDTLEAEGTSTTAKFRDPSAFYHIHISNNGIFVNGVSAGSCTTTDLSNAKLFDDFDGYVAEVHLRSGTVAVSDFGETNDNGVWVPKSKSGGEHYFTFANSSDFGVNSGSGGNWTATNLASTDQTTDTPTLVYPTWASNFGRYATNVSGTLTTLTEGNRHIAGVGGAYTIIELNSIPLSSGKYYMCYRPTTVQNLNGEHGIMPKFAREKTVDYYYDYTDDGIIYGMELTTKFNLAGSAITNMQVTFPATPENNADLLVMALDFDAGTNGKLWCGFYDDSADELHWYNASSTSWVTTDLPATGAGGTLALPTGDGWMFYSRHYYSDRSSLSGFGSGDLLSKFTAPSGFKQINSDNFTPTVADPSNGFQAVTYLGTGANQTITMGGNSYGHRLGSGDRSSLITVTTSGGSWSGTMSQMVNGDTSNGPGISSYADEQYVQFQFPEAVNITEVMIVWQSSGSNVGDDWRWFGSNNGSDWTTLSGANDLNPNPAVSVLSLGSIGASDTYSYYRFKNEDGSGVNSVQWRQVNFRVKPTDNDRTVSTFQPDLVLIKNRDAADQWCWFDSVRGATKLISSNPTTAEATDTLTAFTSTGFTLGADDKVNTSGERYVAFCFKAGGSASDNDTGSITASVSANTDYGISIAKFTGNGSAGATVGHGLGKAPAVVITKNLEAGETMYVGCEPKGFTHGIYMSSTAAPYDIDIYFNDTAPSSTVVTFKTHAMSNNTNDDQIMYCFSNIPGFSDHSKYVGNGLASGPVIYTGFKPALVIIRKISSSGSWLVYDNVRSPFNEVDNQLLLESTASETLGSEELDFLAGGFKPRTSDTNINAAGAEYLYMAFASHPTYGGEDSAPATAV